MCRSIHLSLTVAIHGDIYETRRLNFVWFRETNTLFEFYGNQRSLRQKIDRVRWFPKELPLDSVYDFFQKFPRSILWNYIHHPSHILEARWNPYGIASFNYIQKYCPDASAADLLMQNICKIIVTSVKHIQSYANNNKNVQVK